jgi:4-aminobutyrate aminotransferase
MTEAAPAPTDLPIDLAGSAGHLTPILGRYFERSWSHGEGHRLYDTSGRAYLDFANGIAVTALGHHHPAVTAAIHAQVDRLIGPTGAMGYAEPVVRLSSMLADTLPDPIDSVMFLNSGSEAIDGALKLARRVTGRPGIVAFRGGFHGRTFGATSVTTSNLNYRTGYEPLLPGVYFAPYPAAYPDFDGDEERASGAAIEILRSLFTTVIAPSQVASLLIEPVRGEGGYNPAAPSFLQALRTICDEHGILLIADEVQTGFARTGRMWGFERAGIVPDVVVMAKAIANGLPLSAIASSRALMERWGKSAHGSTYGGNPVACAAGIAVLETIEREGLVENAAARGAELRAGLDRIAAEEPRIGDVRGPGLMIGVELVTDRETREPNGPLAKALIARAADLGLLVLTCGSTGQVIRWIPPIDATSAEISEAIEIFGEALRTV